MIKQLNKDIKKRFTYIVEYLLEPIQGKIIEFSTPYKIRRGTKYGNELWNKWEEIEYPVSINTKSGKKSFFISFFHIKHVEDVAHKACHELIYTIPSSENEKQEILKRLYSEEFLEFKNDKK